MAAKSAKRVKHTALVAEQAAAKAQSEAKKAARFAAQAATKARRKVNRRVEDRAKNRAPAGGESASADASACAMVSLTNRACCIIAKFAWRTGANAPADFQNSCTTLCADVAPQLFREILATLRAAALEAGPPNHVVTEPALRAALKEASEVLCDEKWVVGCAFHAKNFADDVSAHFERSGGGGDDALKCTWHKNPLLMRLCKDVLMRGLIQRCRAKFGTSPAQDAVA